MGDFNDVKFDPTQHGVNPWICDSGDFNDSCARSQNIKKGGMKEYCIASQESKRLNVVFKILPKTKKKRKITLLISITVISMPVRRRRGGERGLITINVPLFKKLRDIIFFFAGQ